MSVLASLDLETFLIGPGQVAPKPVCATLSWRGANGGLVPTILVSNGDPEWRQVLGDTLRSAASGERPLVGANIAGFDFSVLHEHFPEFRPLLWQIIEGGFCHDVQTREKLLNLALSGNVDHYYTPDGQQRDISYSLAALSARYLGLDRDAEKGLDAKGLAEKGITAEQQDIWRLHFDTLDGAPSKDYPPEAADYAKRDASDALLVFEAQESRARDLRASGARFPDGTPFDPYRTEYLQVAAKFALQLMTVRGFAVNPDTVASLKATVAAELVPERVRLLIESGVMTPPEAARPYKNGARNPDGSVKFTAPEPAHIKKKKLQGLVMEVTARVNAEARARGVGDDVVRLKYTEPSKLFPEGQVSTDGEVIADLAPFDEVLAQFDHWQGLQKLETNEIPALERAVAQGGVIHSDFPEMKKTSRTSARKSRLYPSINIQQIARGFEIAHPCGCGKSPTCATCHGKGKWFSKIEPRNAYVARPGCLLASVDYSTLELVTAAQQVFKVVGSSVMRDKLNASIDLHQWFAGVLCRASDADFVTLCREVLGPKIVDADAVYDLFGKLKKGDDGEKDYYKTKRQFAKSPNLALPGGMGARTLVSYAKRTYNVLFDGGIEQAKAVKDLWMKTFPEFPEYFKWVKRQKDDIHSKADEQRFAYFSPLGTYRANCYFTECANGYALQTPAAEGGKIALVEVSRACYDASMMSPLLGCRPLAYIHDELIVEIPDDRWAPERTAEIERIMVKSMEHICPDVRVSVEPTLMRKWSKGAGYVKWDDGRLAVWEDWLDAEKKKRLVGAGA